MDEDPLRSPILHRTPLAAVLTLVLLTGSIGQIHHRKDRQVLFRQMRRMRSICYIPAIFLFAVQVSFSAEPKEIFDRYVHSLLAGDVKNAETCWHPDDIRHSQRLGITYAGVTAKYDCASPVVGSLERIRQQPWIISFGEIRYVDAHAELPVFITAERDTVRTIYFFVRYRGHWRIISPLSLFTRSWKTIDTRYVRLHYSDGRMVNPHAVAELDSIVEFFCRSFPFSDERRRTLRREKLEYYLTDDATVRLLTGHATKGIADLPSDAVISSSLPHRHELTHLLLNYFLHELPLFTLPWLQEGTAVCLGGRWGRSRDVLLQMGKFLFDAEMVSLDDLLTYRGFHSTIGNPDLSYPASGLLIQFLLKQYGTDQFLKIYRALSGNSKEIELFSADSIRSCIAAITKSPWEQITGDFQTFRRHFPAAGIIPGTPHVKNTFRQLNTDGFTVRISESDSMILFDVRPDSLRQKTMISILFRSPDPVPVEYRSTLFEEHFPGLHYKGERYSLRISSAEAGWYDYHTNLLLAKFVANFTPSAEYSGDDGMLHCMLQKKMLPRTLAHYGISLTAE